MFKRGGATRSLDLSGIFGIALACGVLAVAGAGFATGLAVGGLGAESVPVAELEQLRTQLDLQQGQLAALRGNAREEMDALAIRVGATPTSFGSMRWDAG